MIRLFALGATTLLLVLGSASSAWAVFYGNFDGGAGSTVEFLNVADVNGLYGSPTAFVNTLNFSPNLFETSCTNGGCGAEASIDDTLTFQVDADPGNFVDDIRLTEQGDFNFTEFIGGAVGITTVTADIFVDILEVNGSAPSSAINASTAMVFTSGGDYTLAEEGTGLQEWNGSLLLDLDGIIAGFGASGRATLVEVSISNTLTAFASTGAIATMEKKDVSGLAITVIPEPGTALLMGLGLAGLAAGARRRD